MCQHVLEKFKEIKVRNKNSPTLNLVWPLCPCCQKPANPYRAKYSARCTFKVYCKAAFLFFTWVGEGEEFQGHYKKWPF